MGQVPFSGPGGIESLEHVDSGNHPVSHAQNKSPMRMTFKTAAIALVLCLVLQVQADTLLGRVVSVADGDTITVLDDTNTQHKIRLTGIDAPEKRQAFGNVSKQSLADMVAGQSVVVEWVKADRHARPIYVSSPPRHNWTHRYHTGSGRVSRHI